MGRLTARLAVFAAMTALAACLAPSASAASWATFGTPTAHSTYGTGIEFSQPVTVDRPLARVELLLTVANAIGPSVIVLAAPDGTGSTTLDHLLDTTGDSHLLPNTPISARWRLVAADDPTDVVLGPEVRVTYADDRYQWQTEAGSLVRVHWYNGSAEFGRRALRVAEDGMGKAADLFGVTESKPVDFYVYADQQAFYDALGPGTRENVGGEADASIRTLFALIPPTQIDDAWVGIVIPHELTHLVIDTAAGNPYHFLPRWLNEGLAVDESQGYDTSDRGLVSDAVAAGTLIPLDGLVGQFPTSADGFYLAYAESVSAVDFLLRTYGRDGLVTLVKSYKDGRTDDEAFKLGLGVDAAAFSAAWLASLGAAAPERFGPQPAPAGPIPSAWSGGAPAAPTASAGAGSSRAATPGPAAPATASGSGDDATMVVVTILAVLVAIGLMGWVVVRRGRRAAGNGPGT
jgi:Peptidase MA superfamily